MSPVELTPAQAAAAVREGKTVRLVVGTDSEDPVILTRDVDGMAISTPIAGWSEGIVEPICETSSDFLETYWFHNAHSLTEEIA